jgi:hypothetical protein
MNCGMWISDCGLKKLLNCSLIRNPQSEIRNRRNREPTERIFIRLAACHFRVESLTASPFFSNR